VFGLSFRETMSGGYHLCTSPDVDRPMRFTVRASIDSLRSLLGNAVFTLQGAVLAEGLADHKRLDGTLTIDPLRAKLLVYVFRFEGNDGAPLTFQGRKTLSEGSLLHAMTVLPGGIFDAAGHRVGEALLRFDLRSDLLKFLRSFTLTRAT
jgi:hypothetical protein